MNDAKQKPGTMINTPGQIQLFRMYCQKAALKMEMLGLKKKGRTAYSMIKEEYDLKGSKKSVLEQLQILIEHYRDDLLFGDSDV
jgi:hypothetical protein